MDARATLLLNFNVPETSLDSMLDKGTVAQTWIHTYFEEDKIYLPLLIQVQFTLLFSVGDNQTLFKLLCLRISAMFSNISLVML